MNIKHVPWHPTLDDDAKKPLCAVLCFFTSEAKQSDAVTASFPHEPFHLFQSLPALENVRCFAPRIILRRESFLVFKVLTVPVVFVILFFSIASKSSRFAIFLLTNLLSFKRHERFDCEELGHLFKIHFYSKHLKTCLTSGMHLSRMKLNGS